MIINNNYRSIRDGNGHDQQLYKHKKKTMMMISNLIYLFTK